jgi:hypothetical protein
MKLFFTVLLLIALVFAANQRGGHRRHLRNNLRTRIHREAEEQADQRITFARRNMDVERRRDVNDSNEQNVMDMINRA